MPSSSGDNAMTTLDKSDSKESSSRVPVSGRTSSNPLEKFKRLDSSIQNATDRVVNEVDLVNAPITVENKVSIAPSRSVQSQTPRITHATETIRARVTTDQLKEKHAKYLSDPQLSTSIPSSSIHPNETSVDSLSNIKIVDDNSYALSRSNGGEDSIKSVNGKLDIEELEVDKTPISTASTEKIVEEHEIQLQKQKNALINSSRIDDHVQQDNSLTSFQPAVDRPSIKATTVKPLTRVGLHQSVHIVNIDDHKSSTESQANEIPESTMRVNPTILPEIVTEKSAEKEIQTTTDGESTTTTTANDETTIFDTMTTSEAAPKIKTTIKSKENLVALNESQTTTESIETDPTTVPTSTTKEATNHRETTPNDVSHTGHIVIRSTTASPSTVDIDSTTVEMTKPNTITSHGPIAVITTPSEKVTKISDSQPKVNTPTNEPSEPSSTVAPTSTSTSTFTPISIMTTTTMTTSTSSSTTTTPAPILPDVSEKTSAPINPTSILGSTVGSIPTKDFATRPTILSSIDHPTEIATKFDNEPTDVNAMIAIGISIIAVITLVLLVGFLFVMRKRQKQLTYGQRCRPIGLDAYSLDNVSVYNSVRRKSAMRASKRTFGNAGFDDPALKNNPLTISQLATFSQKRVSINDEFREIPTVTARIEEVPAGCEDKNR